MSKKIATVSTVFAACDKLDAAKERWNREDVRAEVGGGGYVVIDPLIRAWRELKPLRELAPTTPTDLLHQVAESLEAHCQAFMGGMEEKMAESRGVFEATVAELSERLAVQEADLQERDATLQAMEQDRSELASQLDDCKQVLSEQQQSNVQLQSESDGLCGQVARLETEHKKAIEQLRTEAGEQAQLKEQERSSLTKEHKAELARQRQELTEAAELAENRLMKILDDERQQSRQSADQLTHQLTESQEKAQTYREKTISLEASLRQLTEQHSRLSDELSSQAKDHVQLTGELERERKRNAVLQREYESSREEHKIGGQLADLQATIVALQKKMG